MINCQRTLVLIKPDGLHRGLVGDIIARLEKRGLKLIAMDFRHIDKEFAETHYAAHKGKPFLDELVEFMISGPVVVSVLEGENAVAKNREIMGATDPAKAAEGTIRKDFAESIGKNAVHGSDSLENAQKEISFFFTKDEIFSK